MFIGHIVAKYVGRIVVLASIISLTSTPALSWGERGHDLVSRVAVRLLAERQPRPTFAQALLSQEHKLAHLANLPDTSWRNGPKEIRDLNSPTHYVDLEYIYQGPWPTKPGHLPQTIADLKKSIEQGCHQPRGICPEGKDLTAKLAKVGHGPFRIVQLYQQATMLFRQLTELQKIKGDSKKEQRRIAAKAVAVLGILSHFVADLANPHHSTFDYDSRSKGQFGLHSYFESKVVSAMDLSLALKVITHVRNNRPYRKLNQDSKADTVLDLIWALVIDSHSRLARLESLDRNHSLLSANRKFPAKRRPPAEVTKHFETLIVSRLAIASDILAQLWFAAWQQGGQPQLTGLGRSPYPLDYPFIYPSYLK